jgi:hypothetical protein
VLAAAEWAENQPALDQARTTIQSADLLIVNLLFLEEHIAAILPDLTAARDRVDAFVGMISDPQIVRLTKMGDLDMSQPASGAMALLKKLRGTKQPSASSGEKQMSMLRRLPKILRYIPGKAQDMRAWLSSRWCAFLSGGTPPTKAGAGPRLRRPRNTPKSGFTIPALQTVSPRTHPCCRVPKAPRRLSAC